MNKARRMLALTAFGAMIAAGQHVAAAHADGCSDSGWGGQCDFNYAPDGSHEHCDTGRNIPFVGTVRNCFWVNTHP